MITKHAVFAALLASVALTGCSRRSEPDPATLLAKEIGKELSKMDEQALRMQVTRERLRSIATAAAAYEIRTGKHPSSVDDLRSSKDGMRPLLDPSKPVKDAWGHDFRLRDVGGGFLKVRSAGPDGKMDTDDDITE